ncbi:MAG: beta-lactamase family protein [Bergeyella sp.]|nr:beta-lactamase family protein [Bergeyella sp.]
MKQANLVAPGKDFLGRGYFWLVLFLIFSLVPSCNKGKKSEDIRNFSSGAKKIGYNKIFSAEDNYIKNETQVVAYLEKYYDSIWRKGNLWGGFLVAKGEKILFEKYRGYAQAGKRDSITAQTPMQVASISKTITAAAILRLKEEGVLSLSDSVTQYFPEFPYPDVTIKTLLNHRSGLPKYEYFIEKIKAKNRDTTQKFLTNQDILRFLVQHKPSLDKVTDTGFMYCNTNYALLALIAEEICDTPFPKIIDSLVFNPLDMKNSYVFQEKDTLKSARSFFGNGKIYPFGYLDLIYGDKNVYTTPRDLYKFSKALFSDEFLTRDSKKEIFEPYSFEKRGVNNYGLGFRMKFFGDGKKLIYHTGWWHGSNSIFIHLLKSKATLIAIGNRYSSRVYTALTLSGIFEDFPYEEVLIDQRGLLTHAGSP